MASRIVGVNRYTNVNAENDQDSASVGEDVGRELLRSRGAEWLVSVCKDSVKAEYRGEINNGRFQLMFSLAACAFS